MLGGQTEVPTEVTLSLKAEAAAIAAAAFAAAASPPKSEEGLPAKVLHAPQRVSKAAGAVAVHLSFTCCSLSLAKGASCHLCPEATIQAAFVDAEVAEAQGEAAGGRGRRGRRDGST